MKIESFPPLYVQDLSEIHEILQQGKNIVFVVPDRYKKTFVKHIKRINKSHDLLRKKKGVLTGLFCTSYMVYLGVVNTLMSMKNKELDHAFLVYLTSWRFISVIDGEVLGNNKVSIIYRGKRL